MNVRLQAESRSAGFSLVEVLIGVFILTIIFLGIVPLFNTSMANNHKGNDSTQITNRSKSHVEELVQVPFDHADVTVPGGATELVTPQYWDDATYTWVNGTPPDGTRWDRTSTVRQFGVVDLADDGIFNDPKDGNTNPNFVQIKEVQVAVQSESGPLIPDGQTVLLRRLKLN